jgi:hypothetical protein
MTRIGLAVLVVLVLAVGHGAAEADCGGGGGLCCAPPLPACNSSDFACSPGGRCLNADGIPCDDKLDCASGFCQPTMPPLPSGICVTRNPAPAASTHTTMLMGAALLLAGLWSVRRVARRR